MRINYKAYILALALITIATATVHYYTTPIRVGLPEEYARKRVHEVLMDSTPRPWNRDSHKIILIKTPEAAISIAEPILFDIYGKEKILRERPYGVHKIDEYWFISGSLQRLYTFGGGFEIILDSRDARVMSVIHYK